MGRKLNLGTLSEEEEKRILSVIQRDFDLRRVESSRIGKLSKDVESEEVKQKEVVKEAVVGDLPIDTLCARCGSKFMWLINPKAQCKGCDLYFCRNKIDCIVYDKVSKLCFCNACTKQRELQSVSGEWFYAKLKGKFRRHGGAKVYRELHKKKKGKKKGEPENPAKFDEEKSHSPSSSAVSSPRTPRRKISDRSGDGAAVLTALEIDTKKQNGIVQNYDVEMDAVVIETTTLVETAPPPVAEVQVNNIEIQTDDLELNHPVDNLPTIKEELEEAIAKVLLPKLEELKRSQQNSDEDRQKKMEDAVKLAEEMIDQALERAKEKNAAMTSPQTDGRTSARSSLKEMGTMTETSDSEMDSASSHSGRGRRKSRKQVPLSERLGSLSPDSLRDTLNSQRSSSASITQGVVLQKDQMVARAEMDQAMAQLLDEQGIMRDGSKSPQEFSTELKFTATGENRRFRERGSSSDSSSDDEKEQPQRLLDESGNWVVPEGGSRPSHMRNIMKTGNTNSSNSFMMLETDVKSPYDNMGGSSSDSDDDREHVEEEQVLASVVRRPDATVTALSLVSTQVEVVEAVQEKKPHPPVDVAVDPKLIRQMSEDIDKHPVERKEVELPTTPPVTEEMIQAVDRAAQETSIEEIMQQDPIVITKSGRYSTDSDSGIMSPVSMESESELSVIPEAPHEDRSSVDQDGHSSSDESSSDDSSSDTETNVSVTKMTSAMVLQPERHSSSHEHSTASEHLEPENDLMPDKDEFGDKVAEALLLQSVEFEPAQQEVTIAPSMSSVSTTMHEEEIQFDKRSMTSMSSMSEGDTYIDEEGSLTPTRNVDPGIVESAVAMRMLNAKSIEILSDTIQNIEEVKGQASDSDTSSKTYSAPSSVSSHEEIHQLNEAEEKVYLNAAETFAMHEKLDQMEREVAGVDPSELDPARLRHFEVEVDYAERQVEDIEHGGNSIDEIMQQLRGAGLRVEKGNFKRHSTDGTMTGLEEPKKAPVRYSLDAPQQRDLHPVNASNNDEPSWLKNTFTVIPAARVIVPVDQSTPKPKSASSDSSRSRSSSESSSASSRSSIHSEHEEKIPADLHSSSYVSGISVEYDQEVLTPVPVPSPRMKKEIPVEAEEIIPIAKPRVPVEEKMDVSSSESESDAESLDHSEIVEETHVKMEEAVLPSQEKVTEIVKKHEESVSSHSFSRSESGSEYTEPMIQQVIRSSESSESESDDERKVKTMKATDGWSLRRKSQDSDSHSDGELHSVDTPRSSRKGMFDSLTAEEQRELARKALLLPETVIADDVSDKSDKESSDEHQPEATPEQVVMIQQEVIPNSPKVMPGRFVRVTKVHHDTSTSEHSSSDEEEKVSQRQQVTPVQPAEVTLVQHDTVTQVRLEKDASSSDDSSSDDEDHEAKIIQEVITVQEFTPVQHEVIELQHDKSTQVQHEYTSSSDHSSSEDEDYKAEVTPVQVHQEFIPDQSLKEEVTQVHMAAVLVHAEKDASSSDQSSSEDEQEEVEVNSPRIVQQEAIRSQYHQEEVTQVHTDEAILVHTKKDDSSSESSEDEAVDPGKFIRQEVIPSQAHYEEVTLDQTEQVKQVHLDQDGSSSESSSEDEEVTPGQFTQQEVIPSQAQPEKIAPVQLEEVIQVHFKEEVTTNKKEASSSSSSEEEEEESLIALRKRQLRKAVSKHKSSQVLHEEVTPVQTEEVKQVPKDRDSSSSESSSEDEQEVTPGQFTQQEVIPSQACYEEVTPDQTIQQKLIPSHAHHEEVAPVQLEKVAQVHFKEEVTIVRERASSSSSSSSSSEEEESLIALRKRQLQEAVSKNQKPYGAYDYTKKREVWKASSEKNVNLRHSYDGTTGRKIERQAPTRHSLNVTPDSTADLDRASIVRGSITMRGGKKMVMTSSPEQSFEAIAE